MILRTWEISSREKVEAKGPVDLKAWTKEDLLAEAARRKDPWIVILDVDPMMRPLRGRPLVEDLVRRVSGGPTP